MIVVVVLTNGGNEPVFRDARCHVISLKSLPAVLLLILSYTVTVSVFV